jgi:hypothetical protein
MVTVKQALDAYCEERNLSTPTGKDYKHAGRIINTHFRKYWGLDKSIDIINSARYTFDYTDSIIVFEYPDIFLQEMMKRIEYFFSIKSERMNSLPKPGYKPVKKERKRIPAAPRPAYIPKNRP